MKRLLSLGLLLAAAALYSCSCDPCEDYEFSAAKPWDWYRADCLPSLMAVPPANGCVGDKPSWRIYEATGQIVWLYSVEGPREERIGPDGLVRLVYRRVQCVRSPSPGEYITSGTHWNLGFIGLKPHVLPEIGTAVKCDALGPLPDQIIAIYGRADSAGYVHPMSAW